MFFFRNLNPLVHKITVNGCYSIPKATPETRQKTKWPKAKQKCSFRKNAHFSSAENARNQLRNPSKKHRQSGKESKKQNKTKQEETETRRERERERETEKTHMNIKKQSKTHAEGWQSKYLMLHLKMYRNGNGNGKSNIYSTVHEYIYKFRIWERNMWYFLQGKHIKNHKKTKQIFEY